MKKYILAIIPWIILYFLFDKTHIWEINVLLRNIWRISFLYIALSLSISPLIKITGNQKLLPFRRAFWVLSFLLAFAHAYIYFKAEYDYNWSIFWPKQFEYADVVTWMIALLIIIVLWITSNDFSVRILKTFWKKIQVFAYPLFVLVSIHVAFASRFETFYIVAISALVLLRTASYLKEDTKNTTGSTRYLCKPCWYIYDESIWDPDSGIKPWTKFEDIPESWRCPVCWVSKKDFVKLWGENQKIESDKLEFEVTDIKMLTHDVMELSIYSIVWLRVIPWQFAKFVMHDKDWEFSRSYSVVSYEESTLKFWIKIVPGWRWWKYLSSLKVWNKLIIDWIYWDFTIKDTTNTKVFIATWTWLSPIMNMARHAKKSKNILLFWVKNEWDVFYESELKEIINLDTKIYLSEPTKENKSYIKWRLTLSNMDFDMNTEFYICWTPPMVSAVSKELIDRWFQNVYFEKFN